MAVSMNQRVTIAIVVVVAPLFVWAGRLDSRVEKLEQERVELRQDLKEIKNKLEDIRERIPAR